MKYIEYRTMDAEKAKYGDGPWTDEPDKIQYEVLGLPALIVRNGGGALCGYVGVPEGHPWYGKDYSDVSPSPEVHGGLTFSNRCRPGPEDRAICHVPEIGDPDDVWWLGFDCAHLHDLVPEVERVRGMLGLPRFQGAGAVYRDVEYVKQETERLAKQVLDAAALPSPE